MIMDIRVSQDHIDRGVPKNACKCPIALAMIEAGLENPAVAPGLIFYRKDGKKYKSRTTAEMNRFILSFDTHKPVFPQQFLLLGWSYGEQDEETA